MQMFRIRCQEDGVLLPVPDIIPLHSERAILKDSSNTGSSRMVSAPDCGHGIHGRDGGLQVSCVGRNTTWEE